MLTFSLVAITLCVSFDYVEPKNLTSDHSWDVLIFTQQWPPTVCKEWKEHNPSHKCSMPPTLSWTIHGIWPTKFGHIGPAFCNKTWLFDPEQIKPIEFALTEMWTNIEAGTTLYGLWAHEWSKHGTCAAVLEPLNSEYKYFAQGLQWVQQISLERLLAEANITPSDDKEYSIADINYAIIKTLAVHPAIECREEDGKSWLVEIRICFTKSLGATNCDGIKKYARFDDGLMGIITNCDVNKGVLYPQGVPAAVRSQPNRLYVQLYKLISWLQWFTL